MGLVARAKEFGFDVLELAVDDPALIDPEVIRATPARRPVSTFTLCGSIGPDRDLSHDDPEVRRNAIAYVRRCVELAAELGAPHFVGPLYSAVGRTALLEPAEREAQRALAVESLKAVADHAAEHGVRIGIEPLNRFETDLVNTAEQALELCDRVGADHVGVLLDTFHMNIDEKSLGDAVRLVGDRLLQVHTCENDRGTPGTGHVQWDRAVRGAARHRVHRAAGDRVVHPGRQGDRQGREPVAPARRPEPMSSPAAARPSCAHRSPPRGRGLTALRREETL